MSYRVRGKIELGNPHLSSPERNGIPKNTKVGINLSVFDEQGELDNTRVQAQGLAWTTRFGLENEKGDVVVLFDGNGSSGQVFPEGHEHAGYSIPNPGYALDGPGISALEHSNGFRMMVNMKQLPEGYYTAFGSVNGMPVSQWKVGDTFRVGKARPRPGRH